MRTRALVASLGLISLAALVLTQGNPQADASPGDVGTTTAAAPLVGGAAAQQAAIPAATAGPQAAAAATPAADEHRVLTGLTGAATALAARDAARAITIADALTPAPGTEEWFLVGAIAGRAHVLAGDPAAAIAVLQPRVAHKQLGKHFPPDVLGVELAEAQLAFSRKPGVDRKAADAALEDGIARLRKLEKLEPIRNFAHMRVLRAQMLAALGGAGGARRAAAALHEVLQEYPNHPERGRMWLEHARALARAGMTKDAMAELRAIAIERNGEPEGTLAWEELDALVQAAGKTVTPLSAAERLASATAARRNKRVDVSRELLEQLIADPATPASIRAQAERSRSFTAAKQRDFGTCAADLRKLYAASGSLEVRDDLLKCLEKGAFYDEAIELRLSELASSKGSKRSKRSKQQRAHVQWEALDLAVRGGKYERAKALLAGYEKDGKAHGEERAWLHPWLAYRTGDEAAAIAGFAAYEKKHRGDAGRRARYFRGKLQLRAEDPTTKAEGERTLRTLAASDALDYYGVLARQRLADAGAELPPLPKLEPTAEELDPPTRAQAQSTLDRLSASYGDAWPSIARARALYRAGYNDEARRELRVTVQAYLTRGKKAGGPRNEDVLVGLAWKPNWKYPRVAPTKAGRKTLRDKEVVEDLRTGLREVAFAMQEPHLYIKLSTPKEASLKARWTVRAFRPAIEREARLRKIDPKHLWALMYTESRFRPHVVSPVGARGALQIMPWTAHQLAERLGETDEGHFFDADRLFDIDTNAHLSAYYVAELLAKFHGQAPMAYASYNGGPSNVARWLAAKSQGPVPLELDAFVEEIPFRESYRYAKRVTEVYATYALLYEGDIPRGNNAVDPSFEDNIDF
ncbi:MAG: lytic transglycosylase domain-containing protein [Nannocystaceae bacterium]|nr:lytic transglycosylase domain-containing protein [Nannocystaceae bacterium]